MRYLPASVLAVVLSAVAVRAEESAAAQVRVGNHDGFGRVVIELARPAPSRVVRDGQRVTLQFDADAVIDPPSELPRNVRSMTGGIGRAEITLAAGATLRDWRTGGRLVIDVFDPVRDPAAAPSGAAPSGATLSGATPSGVSPSAATPLEATPSAERRRPRVRSAPGSAPTPLSQGTASVPSASPDLPRPSPPLAGSPLAVPPAALPSAATTAARVPPAASPRPAPPSTGTAASEVRSVPATSRAVPTSVAASPAVPGSAALQRPVPPTASGTTAPSAASPARLSSPADAAHATVGGVDPVPVAAPQVPTPPPPEPLAASAARPAGEAPAFTVPFGPAVGAAAFRRGDAAIVVFDERRPVDLGPLRDDPVFGGATAEVLAAGTLIRLPLAAGTALSLSRAGPAWRIAAVPAPLKLVPIQDEAADGRLALKTHAPGKVVTIADPDTGGVLLVGTALSAGEGVAVGRCTPELTLLPTWQGVAIEPLADSLALRVGRDRFLLTGGSDGLALSSEALPADASALTRAFDFPALRADALAQRMKAELAAAADAPAMRRGPQRRDAAQTMIALGLGPEAQAILQLAAAQDPGEAASPRTQALTAVAALVAGRPEEAQALLDPALDGTDEIALWRAVLAAERQAGAPQAAALFAATLPLVQSYPAELRDLLLPLAAETMAAGGQAKPVTELLERRKDDPALALARGILKEAQGDTDGALTVYDTVAAGHDRARHAKAAVRAVELRLAAAKLDAGQAADALDKLLYAWRGDATEIALRHRIAELRARTGAWRTALALLRESEALDPDHKPALHARLQSMFDDLVGGDALDRLSPLDLVALLDENADLLRSGPNAQALSGRLADRLLALDLPRRAAPVLEKLMQQASGAGRAELGARLAALRLGEGDADGAAAALSASAEPDLPADLTERRGLAQAAAEARRGETEHALATLAAIATPAADEARATMLERIGDWPGAERALTAYAARTVPAEGKLDDAQRATLLRLATAAARAGDATSLSSLRIRDEPRMASGPIAEMFRLLTADPVRGVGDLTRAGREAGLARGLPQQINALQGGPRL